MKSASVRVPPNPLVDASKLAHGSGIFGQFFFFYVFCNWHSSHNSSSTDTPRKRRRRQLGRQIAACIINTAFVLASKPSSGQTYKWLHVRCFNPFHSSNKQNVNTIRHIEIIIAILYQTCICFWIYDVTWLNSTPVIRFSPVLTSLFIVKRVFVDTYGTCCARSMRRCVSVRQKEGGTKCQLN